MWRRNMSATAQQPSGTLRSRGWKTCRHDGKTVTARSLLLVWAAAGARWRHSYDSSSATRHSSAKNQICSGSRFQQRRRWRGRSRGCSMFLTDTRGWKGFHFELCTPTLSKLCQFLVSEVDQALSVFPQLPSINLQRLRGSKGPQNKAHRPDSIKGTYVIGALM